MCQACSLEGIDWRFRNGPSKSLFKNTFYRIYTGRKTTTNLCRICSVELFHEGEGRFLRKHPRLALKLSKKKSSSSDEFNFMF